MQKKTFFCVVVGFHLSFMWVINVAFRVGKNPQFVLCCLIWGQNFKKIIIILYLFLLCSLPIKKVKHLKDLICSEKLSNLEHFFLSIFFGRNPFFVCFVCFSNLNCPPRSPIGLVLCVPSNTLGSPGFKGVTQTILFLLLMGCRMTSFLLSDCLLPDPGLNFNMISLL